MITTNEMITEDIFPAKVTFGEKINQTQFTEWYLANKSEMDRLILKNGAILFEGVEIQQVETFDDIVTSLYDKTWDYVDGFSPRTKLSGNVYTSTEYDADFHITLHNELSYSTKWPDRLIFSCLIPSATGGETPLADCRKILTAIDQELLAEMKAKGVRYVRNLHGGEGAGPSWQQTFESEDKSFVEKFCEEGNIEYHWKSDGGIKLVQNKPATIMHPLSGEEVWFNQVDQFHPSHLSEEIYEALMFMYDSEEDLPMFGSFGDGTALTKDHIKEIHRAIDEVAVARKWNQGDLVMVDNVMVCHGRKPYTGERKILVSMV